MSKGEIFSDLARVRALFQLRAVCAAMGIPQPTSFPDNRPDNTGLDDGPYLPGCAPRKMAAPKSADEISEIRARAWETRRAKYGRYGHR